MATCAHTLFGAGVLLITCAVTADAEPIRFAFDVTVTSSSGPSENLFGSPVVVASQLAGSITFDRMPTDVGGNFSEFLGDPYGIRINFGHGLYLQDLSIASFDYSDVHGYEAITEEVPIASYARVSAEMIFHDPPGALPIVGDAPNFPSNPAILNAFPDRRFFLFARISSFRDEPPNPLDVDVRGEITSVARANVPVPTPEPSTLLLIGSALAVAIACCNRR